MMGFFGLGGFFMLAFLFLGIIVFGALYRGQMAYSVRTASLRPQEVLRARYARGELDREAYLRLLEDLEG